LKSQLFQPNLLHKTLVILVRNIIARGVSIDKLCFSWFSALLAAGTVTLPEGAVQGAPGWLRVEVRPRLAALLRRPRRQLPSMREGEATTRGPRG
jgi:hypothetical protein